jgi:hypothetical protein
MHRALPSAAFRSFVYTVVLSAFASSNGQTNLSPDTKLALNAALILTPEFCATKMKAKNGQTFEVGRVACTELEPALRGAFTNLTSATATSSTGDAQVILVPRFVTIDRTGGITGFSGVKTVLLVEWTVTDTSGKTVWLETVQGAASGHQGNMGSVKKNRDKDVFNVVRNAAEQSASKMAASPELRKLAGSGARL